MEPSYTLEGILYSLRNRNSMVQEAGAVNQTMIIPTLDMARALQQAKLTKKQREAIDCVYVFDLSYRESALVLGCHYTRVPRRLYSAYEKIEKVLLKWQIEEEKGQ